MATNIYLGYPPENIKQWIIADAERKYQELLQTPLTFTAKEDSSVAFGCWNIEDVYDEETGEYTSTKEPYLPEYDEDRDVYYVSVTDWEENIITTEFSLKLNYSIDNGKTWQKYNLNENINLASGQSIMLKATAENFINNRIVWIIGSGGDHPQVSFKLSGNIVASGNINSLLTPDFINPDSRNNILDYEFCYLFNNESSLVSASKMILPSKNIMRYGYAYMFGGCDNLVDAPELPATNIGTESYGSMFMECTSLTKAPKVLPIKSLMDSEYFAMFLMCSSLKTAPKILAEEFLGNDKPGYEHLENPSYQASAMGCMFTNT